MTVDFFEYIWNDAYVRCLKKHDSKSILWLEKTYIQQALNALTIAHDLSILLFNRDIKNILLLHSNAFTAHMISKLLKAYKAKGVKFISMPEALKDEAYALNPNVIGKRTYTFLNQLRLSRGLDNPSQVKDLYQTLPENEISALCREDDKSV